MRLFNKPDDPTSSAPFRSFETSPGSNRSARRNSPSAVAFTACDSSSKPSVSVCNSDTNGISPRSSRTAALARARRSQLGNVGKRANTPQRMSFPDLKTSSSITSAAAAAFTEALGTVEGSSSESRGVEVFLPFLETPLPTSPTPEMTPEDEPPTPPDEPSGRCGSIATTTLPATRRK